MSQLCRACVSTYVLIATGSTSVAIESACSEGTASLPFAKTINHGDQHMSTATGFTGGCACDAIRYQTTADPVLMLHCHCRDCQRASGGPFSSFIIVPAETFKLMQGSLRFHASPSEMGGMTRRGFCPDCGAPVVVKPDAVPQFVAIRTASLDDPSWYKPQMDVWISDAHPWDEMNSALPKFERYPQ
jgi:hypothetical protein